MAWVVARLHRLRRDASNVDTSLRLVHTELDRRYEYIPGLILAAADTVGRDFVAPVTGARALAMRIREEDLDPGRQAGAEKALTDALQSVLATARRYPQLTNDWAFVRPAHELDLTEQRLAGAVRVYNDQARSLNRALTTFPANLLGKHAGIGEAPLFEATLLAVPPVGATESDVTGSDVTGSDATHIGERFDDPADETAA
ncbi:LemA family protein [Prescottella subtropica]|uniref:LemA family protein n=1 Tax=Prescottella subtropica TaxID=2545757 RepID=UPI001F4F3D4A|nr:LemA family protein [Prescottella subtropica]